MFRKLCQVMFCCRHFYCVRIEPHCKHRSIVFLTTQTDQSKGDILIDYVLNAFNCTLRIDTTIYVQEQHSQILKQIKIKSENLLVCYLTPPIKFAYFILTKDLIHMKIMDKVCQREGEKKTFVHIQSFMKC